MKWLISLVLACEFAANVAVSPSVEAEVPILMYHSVCKTGVGEYTVSPERLREDFAYLKSHGYTAVNVHALIDFCEGNADLPPRPVVVTFDDGFYNHLYYVDETAKEFDMPYTVAVVGRYAEREAEESRRSPVYSYLNVTEIAQMQAGGRAEFANHSFDMHRTYPRKGVGRMRGEDLSAYTRALTQDSEKCRKLLSEACGRTVDIFVYPFGNYSSETAEILCKSGYRALLTCRSGVNRLRKGDVAPLRALRRFHRPGHTTTAAFFARVGL